MNEDPLQPDYDKEFEEGTELLEAGRYDEALAKLLLVYDNFDSESSHYSIYKLKALAKVYPPTQRALEFRRDKKEELILSGKGNHQTVNDWEQINRIIKDKNRVMTVYEKLREQDNNSELLESIVSHIWKKLAKAKRYGELRIYFQSMTWHLYLSITELKSTRLFPPDYLKNEKAKEEELTRLRSNIRKDGPLVYEIALALKEKEIAEAVKNKILSVINSDRIYSKLILAAVKTQNNRTAQVLAEQALSSLPVGKRKRVEIAIAQIP